jgi:hypothetical protein
MGPMKRERERERPFDLLAVNLRICLTVTSHSHFHFLSNLTFGANCLFSVPPLSYLTRSSCASIGLQLSQFLIRNGFNLVSFIY